MSEGKFAAIRTFASAPQPSPVVAQSDLHETGRNDRCLLYRCSCKKRTPSVSALSYPLAHLHATKLHELMVPRPVLTNRVGATSPCWFASIVPWLAICSAPQRGSLATRPGLVLLYIPVLGDFGDSKCCVSRILIA